MARCEKLYAKALRSPGSLRFEEACRLAECFGFVFARQKGSHRMYTYPGLPRPLNFQNVNGEAKEYQVQQLLNRVEEMSLTLEDRE